MWRWRLTGGENNKRPLFNGRLIMTMKINILNKIIQIKQIVREITFILQFHCPCSYPEGTHSQITIYVFIQNLHSEMI